MRAFWLTWIWWCRALMLASIALLIWEYRIASIGHQMACGGAS